MHRRSVLQALVATAVGSQLAPLSALAAEKRRLPWRNWSGSQQCLPAARKAPASIAELQQLVANSTGVLRPVGAGHSFTPLVPTDGTLVSLSRLGGISDVDAKTLQATIGGGTRLGDIGQPLQDAGQALVNMPDIDEQTLAGSLATATHGTGAGLGSMSTLVTGMQLMTAKGELIECDAQRTPELFQAARVSLGTLGIVTQVRMQNVAPYRLRRTTKWFELEEMLEVVDGMADQHRNFEFFYVPFSGMGFTDAHDITEEAIASTENIDTNEATMELKMLRDWLEWSPTLRRLILGGYTSTIEDEVTIGSSWKNYANERNVRFNEMEYHLPRENGLQALREIITALETQHHEVFFPLEVRYVKGDDIWLSPFYQQDSMSIALHRYFEEDYTPYFNTVEPILRKHGGRPHWGKLNTLGRKDFQSLYPRWQEFAEVRREMDPEGRFMNKYLQGLFG